MAWTTPKTWVTGDIVLRSDFDTYLRDNGREMAPAKVTAKGSIVGGLAANSIGELAASTNGYFLEADSGETLGFKWANDNVPSGLIMLISSGACPSGWTEYTTAAGRAIVGTPASGTDEGTVGTALTDLQDKTHSHSGAAHTHATGNQAVQGTAGAVASIVGATTASGGGAATTSTAMSGSLPYIQLRLCEKD